VVLLPRPVCHGLAEILNVSAPALHRPHPEGSVLSTECTKRRPFIIFMAGGMGSGKTHALRWANAQGFFDTMRYVYVRS
jgi:hypothetical protein